MKNKRLCAMVFGPQGCGKSTQGMLLSERFDIPHICAGDAIRAEIAEQTMLGRLVAEYVDQGLLAPDELVNAIMARHIKRQDLERGFVLDGYPRQVEQAAYLDRIMEMNLAVQIKITDEEAVQRLGNRLQCAVCRQVYQGKDMLKKICPVCGKKLVRRDDDTEPVIRQRLTAYHYMTAPLANYYRQRGILLMVNGQQAVPYVFEEIIRKITKLGFG